MLIIDILIRQINAARIGRFSINYHNFPVIPVVQHERHKRYQSVECHAFDPLLLDGSVVVFRQKERTSDVIVDQPYLHSRLCLPLQDIQYRIPHLSFLYNKKFQKDKMLGLLKILQQAFPPGTSIGKKNRICLIPYGHSRIGINIAAQVSFRRIFPFQILHDSLVLNKTFPYQLVRPLHAVAQPFRHDHMSVAQIKHAAKQRKRQYRHHPGQFYGWVVRLPYDVDHRPERDKAQHQ